MRIGLIGIDMDGTLLNERSQVSPANLAALRDAQAAGIAVAICSGRMPVDIKGHMLQLGLDCWISASNGCHLLDGPKGRILEAHTIAADAALACIDRLIRFPFRISACVGSKLVFVRRPEEELQRRWRLRPDGSGDVSWSFGEAALREAASEGINKFFVIDEDCNGAALSELVSAIEPIAGISLTSSWSDNIEIMPAGVDKGASLARLAARLEVEQACVMAIGDQENDRAMLTWAGWGVAMGNAPAQIQAICRCVTKDNAHDGVAHAIRQWALGNEPG